LEQRCFVSHFPVAFTVNSWLSAYLDIMRKRTMSRQIMRRESISLTFPAFVAGIIGAIATDAFLSIAQHTSPLNVWQFIASTAVGSVAFTSPSYAALGLVVHLFTALFWAYLYAYVFHALNLLHNWVFGGIVWGIVVTICMDALLGIRGALEPLTLNSVMFGLATNVVFYGLPVAWYLSRNVRTV
jgi:hypothetical protein